VERSNTLDAPSFRTWEPSAYVQDDYRVRRWLTLNLGLRYDLFTPYTEIRGRISNFDPALSLLVSPSLPGPQQSGPTAGVKTDFTSVAPRIGFAATLPHSMVLRGGFGMSYWPGNYTSGAAMKNAPFNFSWDCGVVSPIAISGTACTGAYLNPYDATSYFKGGYNFAAGEPAPVLNIANATDVANYAGTSISATDFHYKNSYLEQFSLQLQKEFSGNTVTLGYVGNLGRRLTFSANINQPANSTAPFPFPLVGGATIDQRDSAGISRYHALQLLFERRLYKGLTVNANYTWAHLITNTQVTDEGNIYGECIGNGCLVDNPANPAQPTVVNGWQKYDMGNGDLDIRHRVTVAVNYQLPFGKSLRGVAGQVLKGWGINAIYVFQTGLPFTVTDTASPSGIPGLLEDTDRPDEIASPNLPHPTIAEWFNTSAFKKQTPGTLGDEWRNQLHGPPQRRMDFSLFKEFPLHEALRLQFRAEVFNLSNTPNFTNPGFDINTPSTFGVITGTNPQATPREIQFALKLLF
jgi:hypothetical protein